MGGQNDQAAGVHIDEGHHDRRFRAGGMRQLAGAGLGVSRHDAGNLLQVVQSRLVAVVAIGDDQFLVGHGSRQHTDDRRIADAPQPVQHAVLVGDFGIGGAAAIVENLLHAASGVRIEHENLAEVSVRGLEQIEPVAPGFGEGLLMAEDDLVGIVVELAERDKTAPSLTISDPGSLKRCE